MQDSGRQTNIRLLMTLGVLLWVPATNAADFDPLQERIERLRIEVAAASVFEATVSSFAPSPDDRSKYAGFADDLIRIKSMSSSEKKVAELHDLLPNIAEVANERPVSPHEDVIQAIIGLHSAMSETEVPPDKDHYLTHDPMIVAEADDRTITIYGSFQNIRKKYDPKISVTGTIVEATLITDSKIIFELPDDVDFDVPDLWFSIIAGTRFRPLEFILIRETIRDKHKIFIREDSPLFATVSWHIPAEESVESFSRAVQKPYRQRVSDSKRDYQRYKVTDLLPDADELSSKFRQIKIHDLKWNTVIRNQSSGCDKPNIEVRWDADSVTTIVELWKSQTSLKEQSSKKVLGVSRAQLSRIQYCELDIMFLLAPTFQGIKEPANWNRQPIREKFEVRANDSTNLKPPGAFWTATVSLEYDAKPLNYAVTFDVDVSDNAEGKVFELPGWRISAKPTHIDIEYESTTGD